MAALPPTKPPLPRAAETAILAREMRTFKDFPPPQKPGSFSIGDALQKITVASESNN
jgi:hypothetical protein